jgi:hypothetical protein
MQALQLTFILVIILLLYQGLYTHTKTSDKNNQFTFIPLKSEDILISPYFKECFMLSNIDSLHQYLQNSIVMYSIFNYKLQIAASINKIKYDKSKDKLLQTNNLNKIQEGNLTKKEELYKTNIQLEKNYNYIKSQSP